MNITALSSKGAGRPGSNKVAVALLGAAALLFIGLGKWQLDRADEKRQLAETLAASAKLPPLVLTGTNSPDKPAAFRKASAHGVFETEARIFIANRRFQGQNGYHVVTPFHLAGSEHRLLVNRGWVAAVDGQPPLLPAIDGLGIVHGEIDYPEPPALVLADAQARKQWGEVWPYLTVEDFAEQVEYPVLPMLLLQEPDQASAFRRDWSRKPPNPGMHIGYAIQWFAFAAIATGVAVSLFFRKARHG